MCLVLERAEQMAEFREESLVTRNGLGVLNFLTEVQRCGDRRDKSCSLYSEVGCGCVWGGRWGNA